ncbi:MAG TPA: ABC transporter permease [Bacteroidia bacterium]|nr:ABC transporter permease [Bacteroidia bacterium]
MKIYLRLLRESVIMAWHALVVNKLRTILSLLGVTIGIFAIIAVFTAVDGLENTIKGSVNSLGSNVIYVQKWPWVFGSDFPWWKYWQRPVASYKEMEQLKARNSLAEQMAFVAFINDATIKSGTNAVDNAEVDLVSHDYKDLTTFNLEQGRYFTENESMGGAPVAVIGADIADAILPGVDPIDKEITVKGRRVHVIGVFVREGESMLGKTKDKTVMVPVNFARKFLDIRSERLNPMIMVKGKEGVTNNELIDELRSNMRSIRRLRPSEDDSFALNETKLLSNQLGSLFHMLTVAGWIIGSFSILVGGFGIANIMFVSVRERTPIIGIQKSLGAKNYFILFQFLTESVILCVVGGGLGIFLVFIGSYLASFGGLDMPLSLANTVLGISVSVIIGIISGLLPAFQASQLDPVEAIRANG